MRSIPEDIERSFVHENPRPTTNPPKPLNVKVIEKMIVEVEDIKQNTIDNLAELRKVEFTLRKMLETQLPEKTSKWQKVKAIFSKR